MIEKIKLENWKNHRNKELSFESGINSIVGNMGSGKSSVLQAISFALFGTFSELKSREVKLTELINRNTPSSEAKVILQFSDEEGKKFEVERKISKKGTSEAILRDENDNLISGPQIQEVNSAIEEILEINEKLWLRTIYAKQNEIDYFLNISPRKRKEVIDELMGLNKFEDARKNAVKLSNSLRNRIKDKSSVLEDFNLAELKEKIKKVSEELSKLKKNKSELKEKIKKTRKKKSETKEKLEVKKKKVEELNKIKERISLTKKNIEEIREDIEGEDVSQVKDVEEKFKSVKEKISDKQSNKQQIKERAENEREKLLKLEKKLSAIEEKISEVNKQLEKKKELENKISKYKKVKEKLEYLKKKIEETKSSVNRKTGELENLKTHLEELKKAEEVCPVCSNRLEKDTKEELVELREKEIRKTETEIASQKSKLKKLKERKEKISEKEEERKKILHSLESYEDLGDKKEELSKRRKTLIEDKPSLKKNIEKKRKQVEKIEKELMELSDKYRKLQERKTLQEKVERKKKLEKELQKLNSKKKEKKGVRKELERTESKFEDIIKNLQKLETKKESLVPLVKEKKERLEELTKNKKEIEKIKKEIDKIKSRVDFLDKFKNALVEAQGELRRELILAVNEVMANIWEDIYPYDKWSGVRLLADDEDYLLQTKETGGDWLSVTSFASGGEKMMASLSLRVAFAKVLAPKLDLLILDEPTHNLDKNAIDTFTNVIEEKLSDLLKQTFIISHEEKLSESAENIIKMKK